MNAYKIISITPEIITVEWTLKGKSHTERLDARYLPINDATGLNQEIQRLLNVMVGDAEPVEIPKDVKDIVGVKKEREVKSQE